MLEPSEVRRLLRTKSNSMRRAINLLGCGGVGSNVVQAANANGNAANLFIFRVYDPDDLEVHNLNRTSLFSMNDAILGRRKVDAIPNDLRGAFVDTASADTVTARTPLVRGLIVDARDTMNPDMMVPKTWIKLAYNGGSELGFTFHPQIVAQKMVSIGRANGYEVVPSFFVPAAFLAAMTFLFHSYVNFAEITELRAGTFGMNLDDEIEEVAFIWEKEEESNE